MRSSLGPCRVELACVELDGVYKELSEVLSRLLADETSLSTDGKGMSGLWSSEFSNGDVDTRSSPNAEGVDDGVKPDLPDAVLGIGLIRRDTSSDLLLIDGLAARCSSKVSLAEDGVKTGVLEIELVDTGVV